jgi:hypothetical protein
MLTKIVAATYAKSSTEKSVLAEIQDRAELYQTLDEVEVEEDFPKKFKVTIIVEEVIERS